MSTALGNERAARTVERTVERVSTPISPLLLTVKAAAGELSVGRDKIFALVRRGELRAVKVGHSTRIPRRELEAYVERLTAEAAPDNGTPRAVQGKGATIRGATRA